MSIAGEPAAAPADRFTPIAVDALSRGIGVTFRAVGDSMRPAILDGDVIQVSPASAADIRLGEVLLCRCGSRLLAHRLVAVTEGAGERWLHLRGDSMGGCDAPVSSADVLGRVESVWRGGVSIEIAPRGVAARVRRLFSVIIQPG
jgi:hypothetical protein